ncbi:MAG: amidinotransferase [Bacteroidetes bacterium]|nr:amidinotransferase [Bacteroidota bacterium]
MIRPVNFGYNKETAESNAFQVAAKPESAKRTQELALKEFDVMVEKLKNAGIEVVIFEDNPSTYTPDSIFPNNWVTFHKDGRVVLYPMQATNRRLERKLDFIHKLELDYGFKVSEIIDLSYFEDEDKFLEGTGSMILDRENKIAYACHSSRTHSDVMQFFCKLFNYKPVMFHSSDLQNTAIYHTNVMMAIGENIAIACLESVKDEVEREMVSSLLKETGKTIIDISLGQMNHFAGNMLQLKNGKGENILVMSQQGFESLTNEQKEQIAAVTSVLYSDIRHIETYGGGSARCMMAEIFNPKTN